MYCCGSIAKCTHQWVFSMFSSESDAFASQNSVCFDWQVIVLGLCGAVLLQHRAHGIKFHTRGGQGAASSSNQRGGHPHGLTVLTDSMVAKYYAYTVARNTIPIRRGLMNSQRCTCMHITEKQMHKGNILEHDFENSNLKRYAVTHKSSSSAAERFVNVNTSQHPGLLFSFFYLSGGSVMASPPPWLQSLSHWPCLNVSCHQPCYQPPSFHLVGWVISVLDHLSVFLSVSHTCHYPLILYRKISVIDYNGLNAFRLALMHGLVLSKCLKMIAYLLPHPLICVSQW